uniref:Mannosyltransferase n=1 Tax=Mesocestoides corti TaxID=53468 RepID=A0A0R3UN50_MESCO
LPFLLFLTIQNVLNVLAALCSTLWNNINDCDETFNYLEPLGFIIAPQNNTGFQTWEYSPQFGLRSYLYLWFIGWPAFLSAHLGLSGWFQFFVVRLFLSLLSYLFPENPFKRCTFGIIFSIVHCFSPGSFISSSSSVPSALAASVTSLMLSAWISGHLFYSVGAVAFSSIVLWPFSACLGIPLAVSFLLSGMVYQFVTFSVFWGLVFIFPMLLIDGLYYGRLICPAWNIVAYNVLSSLKNRSLSQLYGTEPASFYVNNYLLNYNVAIIFVLNFGILTFLYLLLKHCNKTAETFHQKALKLFFVSSAPFLIWNVVFFSQSHKEERFLFPCFPCIDLLVTLILALIQGYSAPMFLTQHLPFNDDPRVLCIGRDWHHFPSHFLLPGGNTGWRVNFLRSDFDGQLPGKYTEGVGVFNATRSPSSHFNDMNLPEEGTYFNVDKCDYIFDRFSKPGKNEVQYSDDAKTWFRRAFYLPFLFKSGNVWNDMHILERIKYP